MPSPPFSLDTGPSSGQGQVYAQVNFMWQVNGTQTQFNIVLERNDTGAVIWDSGTVVSSMTSYNVNLSTTPPKDVMLRWKVRFWDNVGAVSQFSGYNLFIFSDRPVVTITAPVSGSTIGGPRPTITWTTTVAAGKSIWAANIAIERWTGSAWTLVRSYYINAPPLNGSFTVPDDIGVSGPTYRAIVTVTDNYLLTGSDTNDFLTSWTVPVAPDFWVSPWTDRLSDNFNRADASNPAGPWSTTGGSFGILSNQLYKTTSDGTRNFAFHTSLVSESYDSDERVTINGTSGTGGIVGRYTDVNNCVVVEATLNSIVRVWKIVGGVATQMGGNSAVTFSPGHALRVIFQGSTIRVYQNGTLTLTVTDTSGLTGTKNGISITNTAIRIDDWIYYSLGSTQREYLSVTWTNTLTDASFVRWEVWRTDVTANGTPTLIFSTTSNPASQTYNDYMIEAGKTYRYSVRQVATRSGSQVSSVDATNLILDTAVLTSEKFWLLHPTNAALHVQLSNVVSDGFTDETEEAEFLLIGRGRKMDYGTKWGVRGSLTAQIRDIAGGNTAREQRTALFALKATNAAVYLRTPFGDLWRVSIGNPTVTHVPGVGQREFFDLTLAYAQVA